MRTLVDTRAVVDHPCLVDQPPAPEVVADSGRRFATFPVAVLAFVIDPTDRRFLMFSAPAKRRRFAWEPVGGAVESGETLASAVEREVSEEAGPNIQLSWLGTVHAGNFHYDHRVPNMISVAFVAEFLGGEIVASGDLAGCDVRWMDMGEIRAAASLGQLFPPEVGLFERAMTCFADWGDRAETSDQS